MSIFDTIHWWALHIAHMNVLEGNFCSMDFHAQASKTLMRNAEQPAVLELESFRDWAVGAAKRMKISSLRLLSAFLLDSCFKRDAMLQAVSANLNILAS